MTSLAQDLVYSIRLLGRARSFTIAVALTLAVGLAATTTMFTLLNAMLLRPYPFSSPERLMDVKEMRRDRLSGVSFANFLRLQNAVRSFQQIAAQETRGFVIADNEHSELVLGGRVSPDFFGLLGVTPPIGRAFLPNEATPADRIVILSHELWQRRFNSDPTILGRKVNQVVGRVARLCDHSVTGGDPRRRRVGEAIRVINPLRGVGDGLGRNRARYREHPAKRQTLRHQAWHCLTDTSSAISQRRLACREHFGELT